MSVGLNLNLSLSMARGGTPGLDADASALIARMTTAPTTKHRNAINRLVISLKACGAWSLMDALYVMAAQDEQAANLNWVSTSYNLTATGTVSFTAYRGYTPNGSSTYLDTGFNPTTASSPKFTRNDAHMSGWHLTNNINGAGTSYDIGNLNSRIIKLSTGGTSIRPNSGNESVGTGFNSHKTWVRTAGNAWQFYKDGAQTHSDTDASAALSNDTLYIGRTDGSSFGVNQAAIVHFGSQLTAAQVASVYAACRAYLTEIGAI
jgi:hypothetical protein